MKPKITVYIPTYNYASYIKEAIDSVIRQNMDDWELIVINDGSTDHTSEVIKTYKDHPKIRIIDQENHGLNATNNIALGLSQGQYIMRLDGDDYLDENILLVLSNILDKKKDVGLIYPDYYHVSEDGQILEIIRRKKIGEEVELLDLPAHGACTMIRKECLNELKGYEEAFSCQDGYDLWLRFLQKFKPYNINIPLFYYRQHGSSLTTKQGKILDTRRQIKKNFVDRYINGKRPKVLGIVPVVAKSVYSKSGPFELLNGRPLLWYTLDAAQKAQYLDKIVISSEDEDVLAYADSFEKIIKLKRPDELAKPMARIPDTVNNVLASLEQSSGYRPDAVCVLYITTPLRKARHIDKAIDTMAIFKVDSVISVEEELSFCYHHRRLGLSPINASQGNGEDLRAERDAIYKENGAVYISKVDVFKKRRLVGQKIGHIQMLPDESVRIHNEYDYWLAGKILAERTEKQLLSDDR